MTWEFSLAGLLVGILVGMTGMGGGSLMTPILILLFGFNAKVAVGTDIGVPQASLLIAIALGVGSLAAAGWWIRQLLVRRVAAQDAA
jgi:uncharacterized protein